MRKFLIVILAFTALGIFADGVRAEVINLGKHDVADVRKACGSAFEPAADGSGYGCTKSCKSSSGGNGKCTVACDNNNNCKGSTPDIKVPGGSLTGNLNAVLTNKMRMQTGGSVKPVKPGSAGMRLCEPPLVNCRGACVAICPAFDSGILDSGSGLPGTGPSPTGTGPSKRGSGTIY